MQKKIIKKIVGLLLFMIVATSIFSLGNYEIRNEDNEMRGVWVATVLNLDYPSKQTSDIYLLKREAINILDDVEEMGLNTVFLQVRPTGDAFYKSKYFPWSRYLTGEEGVAPEDNFDPLNFWILEAHKRNIELHAWINPYRLTKKTKNQENHDYDLLSKENLVYSHPNWIVKHTDGNFYLDPGIPDVQDYIANGVMEIVEKYDVDGIHLDDYFYPSTNFNDYNTYKIYGSAFDTVDDFRRESVNQLIKKIDSLIKSKTDRISFGVSPFGIWANKSTNPLGSETRGLESFYSHYADSRKWVQNEWIDYIAPQIYWNIGYEIADYSKLLNWWSEVVKNHNVKLYIGHAGYRTENRDVNSPWYGAGEIERQINLNKRNGEVDGSIFFRVNSLRTKTTLFNLLKRTYLDSDKEKILDKKDNKLMLARPSKDIKTSYNNYYLNGASNPNRKLYLNGEEVKNRSISGYFGVFVELKEGENIFVFKQGEEEIIRKIVKVNYSSSAETSSPEIKAKSLFPQKSIYKQSGDIINISCSAPIGSGIFVTIDGKTYEMEPTERENNNEKIIFTTYKLKHKLSNDGFKKINNLGNPVYTMYYQDIKKTYIAPAEIGIINGEKAVVAKIKNDIVDTYDAATTRNGARYEIYMGMADYITEINGDFIKLLSGQWVKKEDADIITDSIGIKGDIEKTEYKTGEKFDEISITSTYNKMAYSYLVENKLFLDIMNSNNNSKIDIPQNGCIEEYSCEKVGNILRFKFILKKEGIHGFFVEKKGNILSLKIKRNMFSQKSDKPLENITILIDPGHGGKDSGALGPLGINYGEKHINLELGLKIEKKLQKLGANVEMTRRDDRYFTLKERLAISRKIRPDLFMSIHADSAGSNLNISKIHGFSVYYREEFAKKLSETILNNVVNRLNRRNRGSHVKDFYVIRGTWTPSILFEAGFVPNPYEFEWLESDKSQDILANEVVQSILEFFEKKEN